MDPELFTSVWGALYTGHIPYSDTSGASSVWHSTRFGPLLTIGEIWRALPEIRTYIAGTSYRGTLRSPDLAAAIVLSLEVGPEGLR